MKYPGGRGLAGEVAEEELNVHGLTKILVIVAAILSVFLSAMVIAYAANTDRIQADYAAAMQKKEVADAALSAGNAQWSTEQGRLTGQITEKTNEISNLQQRISALDLERANLATDKAKAEVARDSVEAKVKELSEAVRTGQELLKNYSEEVRTLRKNELAYKQAQLDLEQRLSDVESQRDVLQASNRALQEQLAEAKQSLGKGTPIASLGAAGDNQPFVATQLINGRIEDVQKDSASSKTLVRLSVGSNSGVAKNMKFYVIRDGNWIGNLVVVQPDLRFSVAEVTLAPKDEIKAGDMILSRLN